MLLYCDIYFALIAHAGHECLNVFRFAQVSWVFQYLLNIPYSCFTQEISAAGSSVWLQVK